MALSWKPYVNNPQWNPQEREYREALREMATALDPAVNIPINVRAAPFNATGTGLTDDTDAFLAAIDALWSWDVSGTLGRVLYIPAGKYLISDPLVFKGSQGLRIVGEGRWASQLLWRGTAGQTFVRINSSQGLTLEHIGLFAKSSAAPSEMLFFDYSPVVFAASDIEISSVQIAAEDGALNAFDYGIRFSGAYGNNSEVRYFGLSISHYRHAGVSLEGTQQKAHHFYGCNLNGLWAGVTEGVNGGKYGIDMTQGAGGQGGQFQWHGGNCTSHSEADFRLGPPNDPVLIEGVQSEQSYRFIDGGSGTGTGRRALIVRGCRWDVSAISTHASDFIRLSGSGPFDISDNDFFAGSAAPVPYIKVNSANPQVHGSIERNLLRTTNSVGTLAVQYDTSSWQTGGLIVRNNLFSDASDNPKEQIEFLNSNNETPFSYPTGVSLSRSDFPGHEGRPMLSVTFSAFAVAATSAVVKVQDLPRGARVKYMYLYQYEDFVGPSISAVVARVGSTSGGQEFILDCSVHGVNNHWYGADTSECGTNFTGTKYAQGGYVGDFANTTSFYVKLTSTGANLNALTNGYFFLVLHLEGVQRFVYAA